MRPFTSHRLTARPLVRRRAFSPAALVVAWALCAATAAAVFLLGLDWPFVFVALACGAFLTLVFGPGAAEDRALRPPERDLSRFNTETTRAPVRRPRDPDYPTVTHPSRDLPPTQPGL